MGKERKYIQMDHSLGRFSCLYVAISVIIKDLYARAQVLFCAPWPPSATFPHHSFTTVAHYLRLRQYIGKGGKNKHHKYIYRLWRKADHITSIQPCCEGKSCTVQEVVCL